MSWSQVTCCCSGWRHLDVPGPGDVLVSLGEWCPGASRRLYLVTPFQNTGPGTHRYMVQCRYWCSAPCSVCLDITLLEILDSVPARVRGPRVLSHVAGSVPWRANGLCPDHSCATLRFYWQSEDTHNTTWSCDQIGGYKTKDPFTCMYYACRQDHVLDYHHIDSLTI